MVMGMKPKISYPDGFIFTVLVDQQAALTEGHLFLKGVGAIFRL